MVIDDLTRQFPHLLVILEMNSSWKFQGKMLKLIFLELLIRDVAQHDITLHYPT
jgi:hypothetical protein